MNVLAESPVSPVHNPSSEGGLLWALGRIVPVVLPALFYGGTIYYASTHVSTVDEFFDFHAFWNAGHAVLHGHTPYPPARASVLAHENSFVYPAPAALLFAPVALIPFKVGAPILAVLLVLSIPLALRIVGVRDVRCYALALLTQPTVNAVANDAISPLLAVGLALAWRYRDRLVTVASLVAALVIVKVFLWPLVLWLALTRRVRAAGLSCLLIAATLLIGWGVIGFKGFTGYPHLLSILTRLLEGKGYSVVSLGIASGLGSTGARAIAIIVGLVALAAVALVGRQGNPRSDATALIIATGAALAFSPIVWLHYLTLLFVCIGIARPRLSWLWALPLPLWILRAQSTRPPIWRHDVNITNLALTPRVGELGLIAFAVAITAAIVILAARRPDPVSFPVTSG